MSFTREIEEAGKYAVSVSLKLKIKIPCQGSTS